MIPRQKELLKNIIEEYVKTAQPVGSKLIVEKFHMDVSPATIRNDMVELENLGLIQQPYTSAGRIPTEDGYKYYVENFVELKKEKKIEKEKIKKISKINDKEEKIKNLAKYSAEDSDLAVFVGFGPQNVYYTGLSNLFSQPEFQDLNLIFNVTAVLDHLDEVMQNIYNDFSQDLEIRIGHNNSFSQDCSIVAIKKNDILFGMLGPLRMDYQKNIELINFIKNHL